MHSLKAAVIFGFGLIAQAQSIFQVVPTPNEHPSPYQNQLNAAGASSPNDIWAVGQSTLHFDGTKWIAYPAPFIFGDNTSYLLGVAVVSPSEAWAAGNVKIGTAQPGSVIERWDGAKWSVYLEFGRTASLYAMAKVSANDIWAFGSLNASAALFEHWDGTSWTATTGSGNGFFNGASAYSSTDIWAVGCTPGTGSPSNFVQHYNGTNWTFVPPKNIGQGQSCLLGVAAVAPNDVWAVGYQTALAPPQYPPTATLIEHYDGSTWTVVPSPNATSHGIAVANQLRGVVALSSTDVWAFGSYFPASSTSNGQRDLLMHWDGTSWRLAPCPNPTVGNTFNDILFGGVVTGPGNVWLVGSETENVPGAPLGATLVLHTTGG